MEASFVASFAQAKGAQGAALGLEMVAQPYQPVLDAYNRGEITLDVMFRDTQWPKRWGYPSSNYAPVFEAARSHNMPLVALDVPAVLQMGVGEKGVNSLTTLEKARYMPDNFAFTAAAQDVGFDTYVELSNVIAKSKVEHGEQTSLQTFLELQMLRDEAMATAVWRRLEGIAKDGTTAPVPSMVLLLGANHVRFGLGVPHRLQRLGSGETRFRVLADALPIHITPQPESTVIAKFVRGGTFVASGRQASDCLRLPRGCGFVFTNSESGESLVESLPSRPFNVATVMLNPLPEESGATGGAPFRSSLPAEGVPESSWPKYADYVWRDA